MLAILMLVLHSGSFVLNGITASLLVALMVVSVLRFLTLVRVNFHFSNGTTLKVRDGFLWSIYWDHEGSWSKVNIALLVMLAVAVIFEAAYFLVFLA